MLDIKLIRNEPDNVREFLKNRNYDSTLIDQILELDLDRAKLKVKQERLKAKYNSINKEIGMLKSGKIEASKIIKHIGCINDDGQNH